MATLVEAQMAVTRAPPTVAMPTMGSMCVLRSDGNVNCVGDGGDDAVSFHQSMSLDSPSAIWTPVSVPNPPSQNPGDGDSRWLVVQLAVGARHACVLHGHGAVRCWGEASNGQLGRGDTVDVGAPTDLANPLAGGDLVRQLPPVRFPDDAQVAHVSAGGDMSCAVFLNGQLRCWGANARGQAGQGHTAKIGADKQGTATLPYVPFSDTDPIISAATSDHTCVLFGGSSMRVKCIGRNDAGQCGIMGGADVTSLATITTMGVVSFGAGPALDILDVYVGLQHSCVVLATRRARCWGSSLVGQYGQGSAVTIGLVNPASSTTADLLAHAQIPEVIIARVFPRALFAASDRAIVQLHAAPGLLMPARSAVLTDAATGDFVKVNISGPARAYTGRVDIRVPTWLSGANSHGANSDPNRPSATFFIGLSPSEYNDGAASYTQIPAVSFTVFALPQLNALSPALFPAAGAPDAVITLSGDPFPTAAPMMWCTFLPAKRGPSLDPRKGAIAAIEFGMDPASGSVTCAGVPPADALSTVAAKLPDGTSALSSYSARIELGLSRMYNPFSLQVGDSLRRSYAYHTSQALNPDPQVVVLTGGTVLTLQTDPLNTAALFAQGTMTLIELLIVLSVGSFLEGMTGVAVPYAGVCVVRISFDSAVSSTNAVDMPCLSHDVAAGIVKVSIPSLTTTWSLSGSPVLPAPLYVWLSLNDKATFGAPSRVVVDALPVPLAVTPALLPVGYLPPATPVSTMGDAANLTLVIVGRHVRVGDGRDAHVSVRFRVLDIDTLDPVVPTAYWLPEIRAADQCATVPLCVRGNVTAAGTIEVGIGPAPSTTEATAFAIEISVDGQIFSSSDTGSGAPVLTLYQVGEVVPRSIPHPPATPRQQLLLSGSGLPKSPPPFSICKFTHSTTHIYTRLVRADPTLDGNRRPVGAVTAETANAARLACEYPLFPGPFFLLLPSTLTLRVTLGSLAHEVHPADTVNDERDYFTSGTLGLEKYFMYSPSVTVPVYAAPSVTAVAPGVGVAGSTRIRVHGTRLGTGVTANATCGFGKISSPLVPLTAHGAEVECFFVFFFCFCVFFCF
jgi:hypothetical protein